MHADVDWANLSTAGAFVLGMVLGVFGTVRVMRSVFDYLKKRDE